MRARNPDMNDYDWWSQQTLDDIQGIRAVIEAAKVFIKHTGDPKLYVVKWHELEATVEALLAAEKEDKR